MTPRTLSFIALILLLSFGSALVGERVLGARGLLAPPTSVATVNLGRVIENLEERKAAEQALTELGQGWEAEANALREDINALREELRTIEDDTLRDQKTDELVDKSIDFQSLLGLRSEELDVERAIILRRMYTNIRVAAQTIADAEGYDIVLVDDSQGELGLNPNARASREDQILQQIVGRRMLYRTDAVDITDELILRMNNAFEAQVDQ